MADIDDATRDLAYQISVWLAPFQPNIPRLYPNKLKSAGLIPATIIASGYPIQTHVMKRLENKLCQVAVFDVKGGGVFPYVDRRSTAVNLTGGSTGVPASGTEYVEEAREKKHISLQVWAYSMESRKAICRWIRLRLRDAYRLHHNDGSVTLLKYIKQESQDFEQADTVYVRTFMYEADITATDLFDATEVIKLEPNLTIVAPPAVVPSQPRLTVDNL